MFSISTDNELAKRAATKKKRVGRRKWMMRTERKRKKMLEIKRLKKLRSERPRRPRQVLQRPLKSKLARLDAEL